MEAIIALCYVIAAGCFLYAVFRKKFASTSLDITALGLFFMVVPTLLRMIGL